jgi:hypothetical protein
VSLPFTSYKKIIIILYLKSPDDIHPLLDRSNWFMTTSVLVSASDHPVLFVIATSIGVLSFYRLWLVGSEGGEGGYKVCSRKGGEWPSRRSVLFPLLTRR